MGIRQWINPSALDVYVADQYQFEKHVLPLQRRPLRDPEAQRKNDEAVAWLRAELEPVASDCS